MATPWTISNVATLLARQDNAFSAEPVRSEQKNLAKARFFLLPDGGSVGVDHHPHRPLPNRIAAFLLQQSLLTDDVVHRDMVRLLPGGNEIFTAVIEVKAARLGLGRLIASTASTLPSSETLNTVMMLAVRSQA